MVTAIALASLTFAGKVQDRGILLPNGQPAVATPYARPSETVRTQTELLNGAFSKVNAPLAIDLFDNPRVFEEVGTLPNDANCLARLARANGRRIARSSGGYVVFHEAVGEGGFGADEAQEKVFVWLDKLQSQNPEQFRGLFTGGVDLLDLDDEGQQMFGSLIAGAAGASRGLVQGTPISVSVALFPCLLRNGQDVSQQANVFASGHAGQSSHRKRLDRESYDASPFQASSDGDLDFGNGRVLPLGELCGLASEKFSFGVQCDTRVGRDLIFVKGRFTRERILGALRLMAGAGPMIVLKESMPRQAVRDMARKILRSLLDLSDPNDSTAAYLKSLLDNPNSIDPTVLAKFGFSPDQVSAATSVTLGSMVSVQGEFGYMDLPDGTRRPRVTNSGLSFGGS